MYTNDPHPVFVIPGASPRKLIAAMLVAMLVAAGLVAGCARTDTPAAAPASVAVAVSTIKAEIRKVPIVVDVVGRTEGSREVEIRARVSGILEKQTYVEGNSVRAGAQLARIDPAPFELALAQARSALAQERARNEQARREADRLKGLIAQKAISQREFDDASTALKSSAAALETAETRVREAELNLSYTSVNAPIAGITGRAQRSEGNLVNAANETSLLTTITQTDPIWVRFALSDAEHALLRAARGRGIEVRLMKGDGKLYARAGRLNFTASSVDARLGTVQLRAEFSNPALELLPGQFVHVLLTTGAQEAILIPQTAVLQGDQGRFVWTVNSEGKAAPRPVQAGNWLGKDWVILGGLKSGDTVAIDNLLKLRPGTPVQLVQPGVRSGSMSENAGSASKDGAAKNGASKDGDTNNGALKAEPSKNAQEKK